MTSIREKKEWSDIEQLEDGIILTGGEEGTANMQAQALANRTVWLKENMVEEINGKAIVEKKVKVEAKDIFAQSGKTVQAELDQKSDTNHTHEGGGLAPEIKVEDAGKVLGINKDGNCTEWKMISGNPVGTIIAWAGLTPPAGYLECSGQILKRTIYQDLFKAIGTVWGTTAVDNFKLPDFTSAARFLRSCGDGLNVGNVQGDAIRNITGTFNPWAFKTALGVEGVFEEGTVGAQCFNAAGANNSQTVKFDASRVVPTAEENRPKNAVVMYCIKAVDEYINPSQVDLAKVAEENAKKAYREDVKELAGTRLWVSGEYMPVVNTPTIVEHGLDIDPLKCKWDIVLVCKEAEHGYNVGDTALNAGSVPGSYLAPLLPSINQTTITAMTNTGIQASNRVHGQNAPLTLSRWRYIFRIWY